MLEAFVRQGVNTTLLERNPYIMSLFDNEMSELIKNQLLSISNGKFNIFYF